MRAEQRPSRGLQRLWVPGWAHCRVVPRGLQYRTEQGAEHRAFDAPPDSPLHVLRRMLLPPALQLTSRASVRVSVRRLLQQPATLTEPAMR